MSQIFWIVLIFCQLFVEFGSSSSVGNKTESGSSDGSKIVGGVVVALSQAPYQVSVQNKGIHSCGGSIISTKYILTAAHCLQSVKAKDLTVRIATDRAENGGEVISVKTVKPHPFYNTKTFNNDFGLLLLSREIKLKPGVKEIIPLAPMNDTVTDGSLVFVSGWGHTLKHSELRYILRGVTVPIINQKVCKERYASLSNQMLCAGDLKKGGKDACQGDSGGPLKRLSDGLLIGVVSFGNGCALPYFPGVYAKVSSVRTWIKNNSDVKN